GRLALFKVNLKDPELTRELVLSHPFYDVSGHLVYSKKTKQVVGISNADDGGTLFFNEELQNLQDSLNRAMPDSKNYIYSLSDDLQSYLVYSTSDIDSGS